MRSIRKGPGRLAGLAAGAACLTLAASACSGAGSSGGGSANGPTTLWVAIVANPQMQDVESLTSNFEKQHPNIHVTYDTLPENELRSQVQKDIATNGGQFDVVMISNYETPLWAKNGWLMNLSQFTSKDPSYDASDIISPIAKSLSYRGNLYSAPFYGESSFLMYRKDLFRKAGLTMPARPTWQQVASFAQKLNDPKNQVAGICLRGEPGWGENLAPLDTVINTFGGEWFNQQWQPQLTSAKTEQAVNFYVSLVRKDGEPGAASDGFTELLTNYTQGKCAMWYDATSAAGDIQSANAKIFSSTGFAYAPTATANSRPSGWLYAWSLGIPKDTRHAQAAWTYLSWATSKDYLKLVGQKLGWARVPPGSRESTYTLPQYQQAAGSFANVTLKSIEQADPAHPTMNPVPYTGVQFVDIPQFEDLGTSVSQQIAAAIAGQKSVSAALQSLNCRGLVSA